ncbi:venom protease-like [Arctopsyche grandis]|uniref:venom protease-like n=1 Tax=Arctopsyche grandis TaxID=121162 RepID=UPI00406D9523
MIPSKYQFVTLLFLCCLKFSIQGDSLLGVNLSIDPVLSLFGNSPKPTTTTTTTTTTTEKATGVATRVDVVPQRPICGRRQVVHTGLITAGQPTKPGDWPWHVAIYRRRSSSSEQKYICGGSLLTSSRVLTACHCVVENGASIVPERLFVFLGKYNLAGGDMGSQEKGVFEIVIHPEFSHTTLKNDIAILKLSSRAKFTEYVQPICLWNRNEKKKDDIFNRSGTVVGWGFTTADTLSEQILKATMPVIDDLDCLASNPDFYSNFLSKTTYCAGFANGTSACNGDSGGGMYFSGRQPFNSNTWYLRGIVSLSVSRSDKNVCDPNQYTIFTDAAQYLDFIDSNLNVE